MNDIFPERITRVLCIGIETGELPEWLNAALRSGAMVIFMEADRARADAARARFDDPGNRITVIAGDPKRMLYKLAGPFDVIVVDSADVSLQALLERLLAPNGIVIANARA